MRRYRKEVTAARDGVLQVFVSLIEEAQPTGEVRTDIEAAALAVQILACLGNPGGPTLEATASRAVNLLGQEIERKTLMDKLIMHLTQRTFEMPAHAPSPAGRGLG